MPCPCLFERSVCACVPSLLCLHRFEFSDFCVRSAWWVCTRASKLVHACALLMCDIQRGCARALLSMWVHAHFFSVICNESWVLISFGDICVSAYPCSCGHTLTIPPPHTLPIPSPTNLRPTSSVSSFPVEDHLVGTPTLDHIGRVTGRTAAKPTISARQRRLCLYSCLPLPAPCSDKTSYPASHPHNTTPLHATTPHSHLPLYSHPPKPTPSNTSFFCANIDPRFCVRFFEKGAHSMSPPTPTRLGKVYKGTLVVPLSSPHQRAFVCGACIGTTQVGISLVSLFDPLFKRSRLHCFAICLT